jgi:hypothetical protein
MARTRRRSKYHHRRRRLCRRRRRRRRRRTRREEEEEEEEEDDEEEDHPPLPPAQNKRNEEEAGDEKLDFSKLKVGWHYRQGNQIGKTTFNKKMSYRFHGVAEDNGVDRSESFGGRADVFVIVDTTGTMLGCPEVEMVKNQNNKKKKKNKKEEVVNEVKEEVVNEVKEDKKKQVVETPMQRREKLLQQVISKQVPQHVVPRGPYPEGRRRHVAREQRARGSLDDRVPGHEADQQEMSIALEAENDQQLVALDVDEEGTVLLSIAFEKQVDTHTNTHTHTHTRKHIGA